MLQEDQQSLKQKINPQEAPW